MSIFQSEGSNFFTDLQSAKLCVVCALSSLAIYYFLGQEIHSDLLQLSDDIYQSEWYHYPRSVRQFVWLMMLRAQQPFFVSAYGVMELNLENYLAVSKR